MYFEFVVGWVFLVIALSHPIFCCVGVGVVVEVGQKAIAEQGPTRALSPKLGEFMIRLNKII